MPHESPPDSSSIDAAHPHSERASASHDAASDDLVQRALTPYRDALQTAPTRSHDADRFVAIAPHRDLARARAIGRDITAADVLAWWDQPDAFARFEATASDDAIDAARTLALRWPNVGARATHALADRLADWCVLPQRGEAICGAAFDAFARRWCTPDLDALASIGASNGAALRRLRTTTAQRDGVPPWPRRDTPPAIADALLREHAARCTEASIVEAADHARGALARALDRDATDSLPAPLLDPADGPAWARLVPALPIADDRAFLAAIASASTQFRDVDPDTLAAALASCPPADRATRAASVDLALLAGTADSLGPAAWVRRLAARPEATATEATSRRDWVDTLALLAGSCSWANLLALAQRPDGPDAIAALLEERDDWDDFDAPGEGELPTLWWRIMVLREALYGTSTAAVREALVAAGADADTNADADTDRAHEGAAPSITEAHLRRVFDDAVSVVEATATRRSVEGSPMSGYAHGLNDGVGEAYGDVYSPADPFSGRRRDDDT